jgi:hypothetical protein
MPPREKPIIDGIIYKNKTELTDFVIKKLKESGECIINKNHKDYKFWYDLYSRHSNRKDVLHKNNGFRISLDITCNLTNQISSIDTDGTEHIFSWRKCISGKCSNDNERLIDAFREAINYEIFNFRNNNNIICVKCGSNNKCEIDHKDIDFIDLVKSFLHEIEKENINIPTKFDSNKIGQNCFTKEDYNIKNRWINYHNQYATLQVLCIDCHNKKTHNK